MKTSRSAITDYQKCPRYRWWKYHYNQQGIEPIKQSIPLVWGGGIHVGVEYLLKGYTADNAVGYALESYSEACQDRKFDIDELESQSFVYAEGKALIEGFTRAWAVERLPDFLGTYDVLEVEFEGLWEDWSDNISLAYRPDALLRKKNTGGLYVFNLKSSYAWGKREQRASRYNVQGLSELAACEQRLGTKLAGIQDEIFIKGSRTQQKDDTYIQSTFLVHPWLKSGVISSDDEWGWKYYYEQNGRNTRLGNAFSRVNVWEHQSMKDWIDMLASMSVQPALGNPLSELFVTPVPHERNEAELREWLCQAQHQEERVRLLVGDVEAMPNLIDEAFPQYRHSCFQYQRTCEFAPLCFDRLQPECGLYQIRRDHHEIINTES